MKKIFTLVLAIVTFATFNLTNVVLALPADTPGGSTIQQRIQQRTKEQNVKLTQKDIDRYKSRCVKAQTNVRDIQTKIGPIVKSRTEAYIRIDAKLWIVIGKLKLAGKDTYNLETKRAEYATKVSAYNNTLNQYRQAIDDLVSMNCEADLTGFIAMVNTVRQYHESLRTQSTEINDFVLNNIKNLLSGFVEELQPKSTTE